jgi:hypothetical protein
MMPFQHKRNTTGSSPNSPAGHKSQRNTHHRAAQNPLRSPSCPTMSSDRINGRQNSTHTGMMPFQQKRNTTGSSPNSPPGHKSYKITIIQDTGTVSTSPRIRSVDVLANQIPSFNFFAAKTDTHHTRPANRTNFHFFNSILRHTHISTFSPGVHHLSSPVSLLHSSFFPL